MNKLAIKQEGFQYLDGSSKENDVPEPAAFCRKPAYGFTFLGALRIVLTRNLGFLWRW